MSEPARQIAMFRGGDDVLAAMRALADTRDMSRTTLDRLCGWKSGQAAKYLADPPIRGFSVESLILMAAGLGAALVLVEHDQSMAEVAKRGQKRQRNAVRASGSASMFNRRAARRIIQHFGHLGGTAYGAQCGKPIRVKIAAKGGRARARSMDRATRRKIAQHAAVIRWERVKAAVKT